MQEDGQPPPDNPFQLIREPLTTRERCHILQNTYKVVPGKSWGILSAQGIKFWNSFNCDHELATDSANASPPPVVSVNVLQPQDFPDSPEIGALKAENVSLHEKVANLESDNKDLRQKRAWLVRKCQCIEPTSSKYRYCGYEALHL